jgi:hypothetical protein
MRKSDREEVSTPPDIIMRLSVYWQRRPKTGENPAKVRARAVKPSPACVVVKLWGGEVRWIERLGSKKKKKMQVRKNVTRQTSALLFLKNIPNETSSEFSPDSASYSSSNLLGREQPAPIPSVRISIAKKIKVP